MEKTLSVLIVDDHSSMVHTLRDILEDEGYDVFTAGTGQEAIECCREHTIDVILMDVRMPDLNGVEAYRRIKNVSAGTRAIMMSAHSVEDLKREALEAGAIAFLQKPLDVEKVLKLIEQTEYPPLSVVLDDQKEQDET